MLGHNLATLAEQAAHLKQVRKADVRPGDWVLVTTRNSVYSIIVLEGGRCSVSGGWFDAHGLAPCHTAVAGCTWGGAPIKIDALAACGLCVEFANRLVTSPVRRVCVVPRPGDN